MKANFLNDDQIPKLSDELKMICEGVLLNNECLQALSKLPNGKSPGEDGLTAEFYKKFWPLLGQLMTDCFNFSYERGELSNSQFQFSFFQFFIVLHHLHHVTTDTLQYIRTIIIPNKRTLHNDKKRKMCAVTKVA